MSKLKATVAAQKKLLAIRTAKEKAEDMEAASKIIFDEDEDLDIQAAALQSYLLSLEANSVKANTIGEDEINHYTSATGIIDSGASATFVSSIAKLSNATVHKSQLRTANGQRCFTSHLGKTALPIGSKAIHIPALVAPSFSEDLISVAQLTKKGNKVLFTKETCFIIGPLINLRARCHHREKRYGYSIQAKQKSNYS